jgi:hypothetical protein
MDVPNWLLLAAVVGGVVLVLALAGFLFARWGRDDDG